ncbi:signal peptide peptidase SppA [bacterium BFN5]|nr:signal peptide peptidase SppA [bacterium BFN5]
MHKKTVVFILAVIVIISLCVLTFAGPVFNKRRNVATDKIAIIYVDGVIMGGRGQSNLFSEYGGTDYIIKQLHEARDDKSVKAIILRINSPGGSAPASQEVGEEIKKVRDSGKLVVTSMGDVAASGGYWLAACSDKIYANPSTLTGSIGVYMPYSNWEELYKKIGVRQEKIKSGPHKDILSPDRTMTEEERVIIQTMVDDMYSHWKLVIIFSLDKEICFTILCDCLCKSLLIKFNTIQSTVKSKTWSIKFCNIHRSLAVIILLKSLNRFPA